MRRVGTAGLLLGLLLTSGCVVNSTALPGSQGRGDDAYSVKVELATLSGTEPNTPVMVGNVNVGTITDIGLKDWHAVATLRLNGDVDLPTNTTAKVAQTSLLGSKHIELTRPPKPKGKLEDGDTIPVPRTGAFPETEDVLASASLLLNGGGLQNVRTIVGELNKALGGREAEVRQTLRKVTTFLAGLDAQKADIVTALNGLDRLGAQAARHNAVIEKTLDGVPPALRALKEERARFTRALTSLGEFSDSATGVLNDGRGPLVRNLKNIRRVMKALADSGDDLVKATTILGSGPFPLSMYRPENSMNRPVKGDFVNLFITLNFTNEAINDYYLEMLQGIPLTDEMRETAKDPAHPLIAPLLEAGKNAVPNVTKQTEPPTGADEDLLGGLLGSGGGR